MSQDFLRCPSHQILYRGGMCPCCRSNATQSLRGEHYEIPPTERTLPVKVLREIKDGDLTMKVVSV